MWPFRQSFVSALRRKSKKLRVATRREERSQSASDDDWFDMGLHLHYSHGLVTATPAQSGILTALIFSQAQMDGASRVRFYFDRRKIFYKIDGTDYEMFPPPALVLADMVKELARASGLEYGRPGSLRLDFADARITLKVNVHNKEANDDDPFLEITGFTRTPRSPIAQPDGGTASSAEDD